MLYTNRSLHVLRVELQSCQRIVFAFTPGDSPTCTGPPCATSLNLSSVRGNISGCVEALTVAFEMEGG